MLNGTFSRGNTLITIIGTGHIFDLSSRIFYLIKGLKPDIVAVELDPRRYRVLEMERQMKGSGREVNIRLSDLFARSPVPFKYRLIAYLQRRLASSNDVFPGMDMLSAIDAAREVGAKIALIDMSLERTLSRLQESMKRMEKLKFYLALLSGGRLGGKRATMKAQIERIESDYDSVLEEIAQDYPGLKKVLIDDRNMHMAVAVLDITRKFENVLVVVGDAHVEGIRRILESEGVNAVVVHLNRLLNNGTENHGTLS